MHLVYKYGGASIKDSEAIRNLADRFQTAKAPQIMVFSAIGKTTNALEKITELFYGNSTGIFEHIDKLQDFHVQICVELFGDENTSCVDTVRTGFDELRTYVKRKPSLNYDYEYDQIVSRGEIIATQIISTYFTFRGLENEYLDIRRLIRTDHSYRDAQVDCAITEEMIQAAFENTSKMVITQGFIASTREGISTTLGREGSDYTAAILAASVDAKKLVIWKDVPGVMNADPKRFKTSKKMDVISYQEAIELSFFGAKVIHPKTIKPLENKEIPLEVRSFLRPDMPGTLIKKAAYIPDIPPVYILKDDQILISISPRDFSFIVESHISEIFAVFSRFRVKVNIAQNSAINYSVCVDCNKSHLPHLTRALKGKFKLRYNDGLQLITIRHFTDEAIDNLLRGKKVYMEQRNRSTAQFLVRP